MLISLSPLQPTLLANQELSNDSLWEIKTYNAVTGEMHPSNSWVALFHVQSKRYFVIKPKAGTYTDGLPPLEFSLGSEDDARNHNQGAFSIIPIR